jgi:two-component system sensor histidine kinase ChvG
LTATETAPEKAKPAAASVNGFAAFWSSLRKMFKPKPRGLTVRRRRLALTAQIIVFNLVALSVFIVAVAYFQGTRSDLVDERIASVTAQAHIVAAALADKAAAGGDAAIDLDADLAVDVLKLLVGPTGMRARVFSRKGAFVQDTRFILSRNQVERQNLPPPGKTDWKQVVTNALNSALSSRSGPLAKEDPSNNGLSYPEVRHVIQTGEDASAQRIDAQGKLIVSVAVPIHRFQFLLGVLMLSTEAGDIDDALRGDWLRLIAAAVLAIVLMAAASAFLYYRMTKPVRELADAADAVRRQGRQASAIPDFKRRDEIGDLSVALRSMTSALYSRIDAIEQFAADVAHEIKNPLTSVASAVETLGQSTDEERRKKLMGVIRDDVRRINRLITDISDASRLDAELSRERAIDVDLIELLRAVTSLYAYDGEKAPRVVLDTTSETIPSQGVIIRGLDGALAQVFRNIVDNAVSFSPPGGEVRITVSLAGGQAIVTVDDQGIGIPEDNLEAIFRRFYTERPAKHGFGKNSGLGLSISRQIVDMHRGRIFASNIRAEPGGPIKGARFTIVLPLRTTA